MLLNMNFVLGNFSYLDAMKIHILSERSKKGSTYLNEDLEIKIRKRGDTECMTTEEIGPREAGRIESH